MVKIVAWVLVFSTCSFTLCEGWWFGNRCSPFWSVKDVGRCTPCHLFSLKEVTLVVRNVLRAPTFEESVTLSCTHSKTLFYMMMEAVESNAAFKFSTKYYGGEMGFFVEAINEVRGVTANQTWWEILDGNNERILVGVSSYEPIDGETVTFNFTQGWGH